MPSATTPMAMPGRAQRPTLPLRLRQRRGSIEAKASGYLTAWRGACVQPEHVAYLAGVIAIRIPLLRFEKCSPDRRLPLSPCRGAVWKDAHQGALRGFASGSHLFHVNSSCDPGDARTDRSRPPVPVERDRARGGCTSRGSAEDAEENRTSPVTPLAAAPA
jgi:hypothetical protein